MADGFFYYARVSGVISEVINTSAGSHGLIDVNKVVINLSKRVGKLTLNLRSFKCEVKLLFYCSQIFSFFIIVYGKKYFYL